MSKSTYYVHTKVQKGIPIDDNDCYLNETANCSSHVSSAEPSSSINDDEGNEMIWRDIISDLDYWVMICKFFWNQL